MLHKKENSNTTAVVEHAISEDDLTHPALYRFKINSPPCYNYHPKPSKPTPVIVETKVDYDLYPSIMRDMKNHE